MEWNSCTFFPSPLSSPLSEPVGVSGRLGGGLAICSSFVGGTTMHCTSWRISAVTIWMDWPLESLRDCVCVWAGRSGEEIEERNVLCSLMLRPLNRTRLGKRSRSKQGGEGRRRKWFNAFKTRIGAMFTYLKFLRFLLVFVSRAREANMSSKINSLCFSYREKIWEGSRPIVIVHES